MRMQPLPVLKTLEQPWSVANSTSVGGKSWQHFSAVCWFFGKQLYDKYRVPIGLVSSNWGGTIVQAWSSPEALSKCKVSEDEQTTTTTTTAVTETAKRGPNDNSVLWNAMIVPLLDLSLKGAIWYQGESNTGHAEYYSCAFPAMITDWRSRFFHSGRELVFLFVQLAPWIGSA
jgi:sialate O-acetylesterase